MTLWIDRLGVVTSVGLDTAQTMGSLRAGFCKPREVPLLDPDGEPLRVCAVPLETGLGSGLVRMVALARLGVAEAVALDEPEPVPLLVCAPGADEVAYEPSAILRALHPLGAPLDFARSRVLPGGGHAAIGRGLLEAQRLLAEGTCSACYVGAVDSLLDVGRLQRLMLAGRVLSDRTPDGFIPGEGAAFFRVSRCASATPGAVQLAGAAVEEEDATRESGRVTGRAMATAARAALAAGGGRVGDVSLVVTDVTGERHRFYEAALATTRMRPTREQHLERVSLGTALGEAGCALGAIAIGFLATSLARGWAGAGDALYLGADDGPLRTAVFLRRRSDER